MSVWKFLNVASYQRLHMKLPNQPTRREKERRQLPGGIDDRVKHLPTRKP